MNSVNEPEVLRVAVPVPLPQLFDYRLPADCAPVRPGTRVVVPFARSRRVGIVVGAQAGTEVARERLLDIVAVLDEGEPLLDAGLMRLLEWSWHYYKHAPGDVLATALPPALRRAEGRLPDRGPVQAREAGAPPSETGPGPDLNAEQAAVVRSLERRLDSFGCHLLDGVTGSGKTEVYLRLAQQVLGAGRQVLVLVPEIGLTPQLLQRFERRLGFAPATLHSALAAGKRLGAWNAARQGQARLVVGTRSAAFCPMPELGLVILDEEHDPSFKQQDGFRYSARDVAVKRAADLGIPVILGSATPSLESLSNALQGRYGYHQLRQRATRASLPQWRVLDLRHQRAEHGLAAGALEAIAAAIGRGEQVMVYLNRRGYAPVLMCPQCGWHAQCERCDAHLTWHRGVGRLLCHHCGHARRAPELCPDCRADALFGAGEGTQQLEDHLQQCFPDVAVLRFDRDSTARKDVFRRQAEQVRRGEACILVGTQMLAKGHHFPAITLVVVASVDQSLYSADYRALERLGQTLTQVSGRAGRADRPGTVILQTHHPESPALGLLMSEGYGPYARWLLEERRAAGLPPASFQVLLRAEALRRQSVEQFLCRAVERFPPGGARAFGPLPALMERVGGRYRMYVLIQGDQRAELHRQVDAWRAELLAQRGPRQVRWSFDVDPQEL